MKRREAPIAVIDSGVGGISVLAELVRVMPYENFIYFGDSANAPYGTKTRDRVREITLENTERLLEMGVKAIVVACNTATSAAVRVMREKYPEIPIVGIEPAIKPALEVCEHPTVAVMATPLTLAEEKFLKLKERFSADEDVIALPCPGLMELIEAGHTEGELINAYIRDVFAPLEGKRIDAIVLGCTHYPFIKEAVRAYFGGTAAVLDGGAGTAREAKRRITEAGLENLGTGLGTVRYISTDGDESKTELYKRFMKEYR
ncbi:MAG: glutamate racemase [Clostridia bacterium]|nr:glutamate racemase [Clostridia bacterium]